MASIAGENGESLVREGGTTRVAGGAGGGGVAPGCCGGRPVPLGVGARAPAPGGTYVIRPARAADFSTIARLLSAAGLPLDGVEAGPGREYSVAVDEGGEVIGVAALEVYGRYGLLRSVAVEENRRGRGVGTALVRDRIAAAEAHGLVGLYALTTMAEGYFRRLGFEPVARESVPAEIRECGEFAHVCPSTAVVLHLGLEDPAADPERLKRAIRERYGAAAREAAAGGLATCGCAGVSAGGVGECGPALPGLYDDHEAASLPPAALAASLGCGNPTALAALREGDVVLDLGSGSGIDVLLSARRVGPTGKVYGVDMTEEMLELARKNAREAGAQNVEFLQGEIEALPLPDASVDVVISNCVINLSVDKRRVLEEAFRVLKPGGRFAVSDIVVRGALPAPFRRRMELWAGCVAGALEESEFRRLLAEVGFEAIEIEPTHIYRAEDARALLGHAGLDPEVAAPDLDGRIMSAFVRARKPVA
jgi:arsenite methyltransferase